MKRAIQAVLIGAAVLTAGAAFAQPGPGPRGPGMGMGPASGPGPGASRPMRGMGPRWGQGVTPGWQMMTTEERAAHQKAMSEMKTHDECVAYRDKHHDEMASRMKDRGQAMPAKPRRDVCAGLK